MWFRIYYTIPGETTMFPLIEKVYADSLESAKANFAILYPTRKTHSIFPIDEDETHLINIMESNANQN